MQTDRRVGEAFNPAPQGGVRLLLLTFNKSPVDPLTLGGAAALLVLVARLLAAGAQGNQPPALIPPALLVS
jgi:hypothetical protein